MSSPELSGANHVLATDLDGTLIPLDGNEANRSDLEIADRAVAYHTEFLDLCHGATSGIGHDGCGTQQLPIPDWLICDVGTSIYRPDQSDDFQPLELYNQHQDDVDQNIADRIAATTAKPQPSNCGCKSHETRTIQT